MLLRELNATRTSLARHGLELSQNLVSTLPPSSCRAGAKLYPYRSTYSAPSAYCYVIGAQLVALTQRQQCLLCGLHAWKYRGTEDDLLPLLVAKCLCHLYLIQDLHKVT